MAKIKKEIREIVLAKYNSKCSYCGVDLTLETMQVDHIKPKYRGYSNNELSKYNLTKGKDNLSNYNPSCKSCNASKSTFSLDQWRKEIELKKKRIERDSATFRILKRFGLIEINKNPVRFYFELIKENK